MSEVSKPLLFRKHRGGFSESMATVVEVKTLNDLTNEVEKIVGGLVSDGMIRSERYAYDERNGWDTFVVTVTGVGVVGFTNGPVKTLK